jgi:hypothetical protein
MSMYKGFMWIRNKLSLDDDLTYVRKPIVCSHSDKSQFLKQELYVPENKVSQLSKEKIDCKFLNRQCRVLTQRRVESIYQRPYEQATE